MYSSKPPSKTNGKLSDTQKKQLESHMKKHKDLKDLSPSQLKSHRSKMILRMKRGLTIAQSHRDIKK
tara:strand:+ start:4616 stop:4816 length:201 start_codon:yes stop_codon:yes gene_type:complete